MAFDALQHSKFSIGSLILLHYVCRFIEFVACIVARPGHVNVLKLFWLKIMDIGDPGRCISPGPRGGLIRPCMHNILLLLDALAYQIIGRESVFRGRADIFAEANERLLLQFRLQRPMLLQLCDLLDQQLTVWDKTHKAMFLILSCQTFLDKGCHV